MKKWILSSLVFFSSSFALAAGGWAAIAYDTVTGNYGYAWGTYNKQQAESSAIANCNALNCRAVVSVYNGHASLVVSKTQRHVYGTGYAPTKFESLYWAYYYCNQGPYACRLIVPVSAHD